MGSKFRILIIVLQPFDNSSDSQIWFTKLRANSSTDCEIEFCRNLEQNLLKKNK